VRFSSHVRSSCLAPLVPRTSRARALLEPRAFLTHVFSAHTPDSTHVRAFRQAASQARPLSRASHPLLVHLHVLSRASLSHSLSKSFNSTFTCAFSHEHPSARPLGTAPRPLLCTLSRTLTCAFSARALTALSLSLSTPSPHSPSPHTLSPQTLSERSLLYERFSTGALFRHVLPALRPDLSWARSIRVRQSGEDTLPFPPAFPRFGSRQIRKMRFYLLDPRGRFGGTSCRAPENQADTEPQQQRSAPALWRETSPPPRRVFIHPWGSVTTRCSFDGECRLSCV